MIIRRAVVYATFLGVVACGGGSSSGGGTQGGPAPTAFAGKYQGAFTATVQGQTGAVPIIVTVAPNGLVNFYAPTTAQCVIDGADGTPFLAGNRVAISVSGRCFLPNLGTCHVSLHLELTFSTINVVGQGNETLSCPAGSATAQLGLGAKKVS